MGETRTVSKEMGISHREFFRLLPNALGSADYQVAGSRICFGDAEQRLEIALGPEGERRIALLAMPVTTVTLTFHGYDEAEARAALARFELSYQRGGG